MKLMPERIASQLAKFSVSVTAALLLASAVWATPADGRFSSVQTLSPIHSVPTWILVAQGSEGPAIDENLREWQSLSPKEKEQLRRRMQQLNRMEPEDRRHFQRLFEQWQQLSPEERRQIERALDRWDRLSPAEKEAIRRRFRS